MNNKRFLGISFLFLAVLILLILPTGQEEQEARLYSPFNERPKAIKSDTNTPKNESTKPLIREKKAATKSQKQAGPRVMDIDSIQQYDAIQKKLDNHPSVKVIDHNGQDKSHYIEHQVVVDFVKLPLADELAAMEKDIGGEVIKEHGPTIIFSSFKLSADELINYFKKRKDVHYVEPNYLLMQNQQTVDRAVNHPNDSLYEAYQWNLRMIDAESGWNISRGADDCIVAVVDTGADLDHPDLKDRIITGYNVVENNNRADDDNGHGTHVTGIIASATNNLEGVAGISWYNPIMPIKSMGPDGYGSSFDIAKGIVWATDNGAKVINLSVGNYQNSTMLQEAVSYAYENDVVLIAATGNDNTSQPSYPAAYPEVLSVAAVDYNGNRPSFSNFGRHVDVTAPGVDIPSTYIDNQYAALSGTSMATPHVTALAALIRSARPNLSNREVISIIKQSSIDLGRPGHDPYFGEGLIDVNTALQAATNKRKK